MRFARLLRLFLLTLALALFAPSCKKNDSDLPAASEAEKSGDALQKKRSSLLALLGEGFSEQSGAARLVLQEYGLAGDEGGLARVFYWPRSFEGGATLRLFSDAAQDEAAAIVIALAAPEGTTRELNRIRSEAPNVKIASLFPSDDALATEAVSDIVVDMDIFASSLEEEAPLDITAAEAATILLAAALAMEELSSEEDAPLSAPLLEEAMRLADSLAAQADEGFSATRWEFEQAADADTGLRSKKRVLIRRAQGSGGQ